MADITVRYASTDQDVVALHQFLCVVAGPHLPGPIDPKKSATEVWRVVNQDVALMAIRDDRLIGTIGLVRPEFWWGNTFFLASRWFFSLPGSQAWLPLLREAKKIAVASELELHIISEERGKIAILNRHKNRRREGGSRTMLDALEQHVSEQNAEMRANGEMAEQRAARCGTDFLAELERPAPKPLLA